MTLSRLNSLEISEAEFEEYVHTGLASGWCRLSKLEMLSFDESYFETFVSALSNSPSIQIVYLGKVRISEERAAVPIKRLMEQGNILELNIGEGDSLDSIIHPLQRRNRVRYMRQFLESPGHKALPASVLSRAGQT